MSGNWTTITFNKIKLRKTHWLFKPFIARGVITTLTGDGGVGKSTCIIDLIGRITTGYPMPQIGNEPVSDPPLKGSALIICKEDDPARIIKARLAVAGADMAKVHIVVARKSRLPDDYDVIESLDSGIEQLEQIIQDIGDVRLILIDPITSFVGKLDFYRDDHIRRLLNPLSQMAAKFDLAVVSVLHMNKDTGKKGNHRILGGGGFVNVARGTLFVAAAAKNSSRRFLMMGKTNLWPERKSVEFTMLSVDGQAQIEWGADYEDIDLDEVLAGKSEHLTKGHEAEILLRRWLRDGPARSLEVRAKAAEVDIHWNTLKTAKKAIGIVSEKRVDGWWWKLPLVA